MLRFKIILFVGMISIFSVILFSEISGSANDNNSDTQKTFSGEIVKFTITPVKLRMYPGGSMQLIAIAYNSKGKKITVAPEWKIKSDISSFGELDKQEGQKVIFSALKSGSGSIVAVYNNIEAEVQVEIYKPRK